MRIIFYIGFFLITMGCGNKVNPNSNKDKEIPDFYKNIGGYDFKRIPLIESYEARNNRSGWSVQFYNVKLRDDNWSYVTNINVIDSIIVIHWKGDSNRDFGEKPTWAFIVPSKKIEAKFENESEYLDSLKYYTSDQPSYIDADKIWKDFKKNAYLTWFPEKYKP